MNEQRDLAEAVCKSPSDVDVDCAGGQRGSPEEVGCPQDHVLEVFQGQSPIMVPIGLVQHLFTHQAHLLGAQLPPCQLGHRLFQVPRTDVVIVVKICAAGWMGCGVRGQQVAGQLGQSWPVPVSMLQRRKQVVEGTQDPRGKAGSCFGIKSCREVIHSLNKYLLSIYYVPGMC